MSTALVVVAGVWLVATTGVAALLASAVPLRRERPEPRDHR